VGLVVGIGADGWVQWVDAVPCRSDPAVASPAGADSDSVAAVPRSFDFLIESPASVEQIHSAFSEKDYWLARQEASGGVARLDSLVKDTDGSVTVVIIGDGRREGVSGLVAKFYPRSWQAVQKESWRPIGGGHVRGEISIAMRGAPGSGHATALLAPAQNGSRLKCTATVEFKVPLIGGKIESMIGGQLVEQVSAMLRFTAEWITKHA
jgi:hypothetical protein